MPDGRPAIKLDFTTGIEKLPPRPKMNALTTQTSLLAGREMGFSGRGGGSKIDGRRLRSRGANMQLNIKITEQEKADILRDASVLIHSPESPVTNIGEFIVLAVNFYRRHREALSGV